MIYIWDTNILLHTLRKPDFFNQLNLRYDFTNPINEIHVSAVTVGEIHSIALRNRWGKHRMNDLKERLKSLKTVPITDDDFLIQMYSEIDVYSQNQHPTLKMSGSARKMGKNDLWIAATTAIANATLISTDDDFTHLNGLFFSFYKIIV